MKVKVEPGQTIYDILLQEYGSLDALELLLKDNPRLNNLEVPSLPPGMEIEISGKPLNASVVNHYRENGIKPASGDPQDFMEIDFNTEDFDNEDFN